MSERERERERESALRFALSLLRSAHNQLGFVLIGLAQAAVMTLHNLNLTGLLLR